MYTRVDARRERLLAGWTPASAPRAYRERLARMRSASARARTRAGLWLLGQALAWQGIDVGAVERIGFAPTGRPVIVGAPAFSIAHSGGLVACALAESETVGIDVEARRDRVPARALRLLGPAEAAAAARAPGRFFDFWCAREATVKASGRVGLARIRAITLDRGYARLDGRDWPLYSLDFDPGHAGCLASDTAVRNIEIVERVIAPRD